MEWPGALSIPFLVEIQEPPFDLEPFVNCRMSPQSCGGNMSHAIQEILELLPEIPLLESQEPLFF